MNVPKLRFKEFNDEWQKVKISSFVNESKRKTGDIKKYPLWSLTIENGVTPKTDRYERSFLVKKEDNYKIVYPNYYVYNPMNAHLGAIARNKSDKSISVSGYYDIFSINNDYYGFYDNYFISPVMFKKYKLISSGSLLEKQRVHYSQFKELKIYLPSDKEQKKIADMLELLDKKIELQTKRIEVLKLFKKGLLNFFFENKKTNGTIENCILYGKAGGPPASNIKDYYNGNIPFLSISDMTSQRKYILKTEKSISQQGIRDSSAWIVPKNSIILSMYASYGLIAINKIELATSQAMFSMIVNSKNNIEYIYYYLEFLYNNNYYDRLVSIGTQANLNADKVKIIKIYLLDINSQNKISKILKLCDERIEYENKIEFELSKFKQGLMQNMFV